MRRTPDALLGMEVEWIYCEVCKKHFAKKKGSTKKTCSDKCRCKLIHKTRVKNKTREVA